MGKVKCLVFLSFCFIAMQLVQSKERCVIVAPRSIKSNSDYTISVLTIGTTGPTKIRIKIYSREEQNDNKTLDYVPNNKQIRHDLHDWVSTVGPIQKRQILRLEDSYSNDNRTGTPLTSVKTKTITVFPDVPMLVKFKMDKNILPGSYFLEVQSLSGYTSTFYESKFLFVESSKFSIFIQTGKSIYRPGELIQFRIMILDADTKPISTGVGLSVSMFDPTQNMVHKSTTGTDAKYGVYLGEWRTSVDDKTGIWEIEAEYEDKKIRKSVECADYVQPRFQVIVKTPPFISKFANNFSIEIDAKYTFGRPVVGTTTVKATPILSTKNFWSEMGKELVGTTAINGVFAGVIYKSDFMLPQGQLYDSILVETSVQEKATGVIVTSFDKVIIVDSVKNPSNYDILINNFNFYLSNTLYLIKVQVKTKNGQPLQANLLIVEFEVAFGSDEYTGVPQKYTLDANGECKVTVNIPMDPKNMKFYFRYFNAYEEVKIKSKALHVQLVNVQPKLNEKMIFQVGSTDKLDSLSYYIVGRGTILLSENVKLGGSKNMNMLVIDSSFSMLPYCSFVVFYITAEGFVVSDQIEIKFSQDVMPTKFSITVSENRLQPKQELTITMNTERDSHVVLSCVDQSSLLLKRGNYLSKTQVFNDLQNYDNAGDMDIDEAYTDSYINLLMPGTFVMTDAMRFKVGMSASSTVNAVRKPSNLDYSSDVATEILIPVVSSCKISDLDSQAQQDLLSLKNIRSNFSAPFLWQDLTVENGSMVLKTQIPESITSWLLTGFSINSVNGLGILKTPFILSTFKPFFVEINLPVFAKMGEIVEVKVVIHNYLDKTARVDVEIDDTGNNFEFTPDGRQLNDFGSFDEDYELRNINQNIVQVLANGVRATSFKIMPTKIGDIRIKVTAISEIACDIVEQLLLVKSAGITITKSISRPYVLTQQNSNIVGEFIVAIPLNAVAGSIKSRLTVQGDKYSLNLLNVPSVGGKEPSGSGVDIAEGLLSYALTLKQALATGIVNCATAEALSKGTKAFQSVSNSQCADGGYIPDEDCEQPFRDTSYTVDLVRGNVAVVQFMLQINTVAVFKGLDFLAGIQSADGSFPQKTSEPITKIYITSEKLSAYVLFCFVDSYKYLPSIKEKYGTIIDKAMNNLLEKLATLDLLSLSLFYNAVQIYNHPRKSEIYQRLEQRSSKNELSKRWLNDSDENTAIQYIIQSAALDNNSVNALRIANGLAKNRVNNEAKITPKAQLAMINALTDSYIQFSTLNPNIIVSLTPTGESAASITVNKSNRFILNKIDVASNVRNISYKATGSGFVSIGLTYQYNVMEANILDHFDVTVKVIPILFKEWQLDVCTNIKSGMSAPAKNTMEIIFPAGFQTSEYIQNHDDGTTKIKNKELFGGGMMVYFENLDWTAACFKVPLYRNSFVKQTLIGSVIVSNDEQTNDKVYWSRKDFSIPGYDAASSAVVN